MVTGWIEKPLSDLFDFSGGLTASRADLSTKGYPYLHYGDIHGSTRTFVDVCADETIPRIDVNLNKVSNAALLSDGDVVFVDASEDDEGASRHVVIRNAEKVPFISGLHTIVAKAKTDELDRKFREFCFQTMAVKSQFKFYSVGTKVTGVSKASIGKIALEYPKSIVEQHRIAEALSDMDALLAALEKLIAKKRAIKQGTMQELLTGKRRLPGFEGEWGNKKLVEYCSLITKQTGFDYTSHIKPALLASKQPATLPMIQTINFRGRKFSFDTDYYIPENVAIQFPNIILSTKCILFSIVGASVGNIGLYPGGLSFCGGAIGVTRFYSEDDVEWVYYYLCSEQGQNQLYNVTKGGAQATVTIADIRDFVIPTPPKEERTAITEILSDMDAEIDALTVKLNKLRNIKQGMMSELLTGRIRLPEQDAAAMPASDAVPNTVELPKNRPEPAATPANSHNQHFDDAVMIAGIVDALYSDGFPLGRKKVQKCLYLLRRHQQESTSAFKKKAAGPYADTVRYKGGEPIACKANYVIATTNDKGTTFARGSDIDEALSYIQNWGKQDDIAWVADKLKYKKGDELELLATVDMAICDLTDAGIPVSVDSIKHLIATNKEWKAKLKKQTFSDENIAYAIKELKTLL